ncbi:flagellar motor protein MotB [Telmatospirillum siberiense]|uniref:Motility protein MotB n=1 Tax=Telmatospirillum siberiense TaxID=382514 RepID=A0A2N3PYQ4_9PROT|nr:flagellar motor protein MotB [Telmatospirillum siberiense]PKU25544.1 motility protein MotB [Telmatospirillum siberiense]
MAEQQPIIIKRIKKGHAGHHGGAWKVAYADFVTAMMAFFLLLWLLNAVTEEQLQGVADYFAPTTVSSSKSGAGGMLGGKVVGEGSMSSNGTTPSFTLSLPPPTIGQGGDALTDPKEGGDEGAGEGQGGQSAGKADAQGQGQAKALTEQQIIQANAQREQQQFERAQESLQKAINSIPELRKMADSLMVDNTPEGLRIQIVDQDGLAMFPRGSPDMYGHTRALLDMVSRVVKQLPEKISISGHTDSTPFPGGPGSGYTNWELSADRALATRRTLLASGVPADRVDRVVGRADMDPLAPNDPANARNRRITIVLLRDTQPPPTVTVTPDAAKSGVLPEQLRSAAPPAPGQALPPPPKPATGPQP